jgi:hypothetical protein
MAYHLGEYVVYGELRNLDRYTTFGYLVLRGEPEDDPVVVHINLTGNCDADLKGKCFRFMPEKPDAEGPIFRREEHDGFRDQQVGPTGTMTAQGWVRTFDCSIEEFLRRSKLGEPPPTTWKRHLYLEWFSQNGRVVVELGGAIVEECVRQPKRGDENDEGEWAPIANLAVPPELDTSPKPAGPSFTVISMGEDTAHVEHWTPPSREEEPAEGDSFQRHLDKESAAIDRALRTDGENGDEDLHEMELIDYCIEHSEEKPIIELLGGTADLPAPEDLDDEKVESQLKSLLGQMAMLGVALDVCEHYSPRDCYRLLRDTILPDNTTYEELIGTGWVTHVMTSEYCKACEEKFEREYDEEERKREEKERS